MLAKIKKFLSNFYNVYLIGLTVLISLPVLAPVLLKLGLELPAKAIYFLYSFFCHQFAYRSIHLYDYQLAWCARDTGIWFGIWITAILIKLNKIKGIKWYWVLPFVVPIALDGGLQTIFTIFNISPIGGLIGLPLYISTNLTRFMTGAIFGIGVSLWLSPLVKEDSSKEKNIVENELQLPSDNKSKNISFSKIFTSNLLKIIVLCLSMFPLYIIFFEVWYLTSTVNKPLLPLDAVVKAPAEDFLTRREDGICPTNAFEDFLALDCFLN